MSRYNNNSKKEIDDIESSLAQKATKTEVGTLTSLTTTDKSSLVSAINENVAKTADYVIINNTANLSTSLASGKNVKLLDGVYTLTSNITSISNYITIEGHQNTIIDGAGLYKIQDAVNAQRYITFKNITFRNMTYAYSNYGCRQIQFIDCIFENISKTAVFFNTTASTEPNFVKRCTFKNIGTSGMADHNSEGFGVKATGGELTVEDCEFSNIYGDAAILMSNNSPKLSIKRNKIHDTYWGGIKLLQNVSTTGDVSDNNFYNIGTINNSNSGVGCSVIYSSSYCYPNVNARRNNIVNVIENGIEGSYGNVDDNYIEKTGQFTTQTTPSIEGIYCSKGSIKRNTIKNPKGKGILAYTTSAISDLQILNNLIINDTVSTYTAIECNSGVSYTNVFIMDNKSINVNSPLYFVERTKTNVAITNNIGKNTGSTTITNGTEVIA